MVIVAHSFGCILCILFIHHIKEISKNDTRLGHTHWDVPGPDGKFGFGGACFPKDVAAICEQAIDVGMSLELLERVETINKKHRVEN